MCACEVQRLDVQASRFEKAQSGMFGIATCTVFGIQNGLFDEDPANNIDGETMTMGFSELTEAYDK